MVTEYIGKIKGVYILKRSGPSELPCGTPQCRWTVSEIASPISTACVREDRYDFGKCKCLHIGPGNTSMTYQMGGTILSITVKEKDLGVTMNANMKVSEQCRIAASKGNQVLGMIRRNITY